MLQETDFPVEAVAFEVSYVPGRSPPRIAQCRRRGACLPRTISFGSRKCRPAFPRCVLRCAATTSSTDLPTGVDLAKPIVLEIHDIRGCQVARGLAGRVIRCVERFIIRACSSVLTTAGHYAHCRDYLNIQTPTLGIEHKIDASCAAALQQQGIPVPTNCWKIDCCRSAIADCSKLLWSFRVLELSTPSASDKLEVALAGTFRCIQNVLQRVARRPQEIHGPISPSR